MVDPNPLKIESILVYEYIRLLALDFELLTLEVTLLVLTFVSSKLFD